MLEVVFWGAHMDCGHIYTKKAQNPKEFWVWLHIGRFPDNWYIFRKKIQLMNHDLTHFYSVGSGFLGAKKGKIRVAVKITNNDYNGVLWLQLTHIKSDQSHF